MVNFFVNVLFRIIPTIFILAIDWLFSDNIFMALKWPVRIRTLPQKLNNYFIKSCLDCVV